MYSKISAILEFNIINEKGTKLLPNITVPIFRQKIRLTANILVLNKIRHCF